VADVCGWGCWIWVCVWVYVGVNVHVCVCTRACVCMCPAVSETDAVTDLLDEVEQCGWSDPLVGVDGGVQPDGRLWRWRPVGGRDLTDSKHDTSNNKHDRSKNKHDTSNNKHDTSNNSRLTCY